MPARWVSRRFSKKSLLLRPYRSWTTFSWALTVSGTRSHTRAEAREEARNILKRFTGSDINPDTLVQNLPLSVQQWIVIVRALLADPRLLILDKSSAALDLDATARLHIEIKKRRDAGCCVVLVTHRIAELIRVADRATVLRDGAVVGELVGADINQSNLLGMMTAKQVILENKAKPPPLTRPHNGDVVLAARGINIEPMAAPFDFYLHAHEIVGATGLEGQGHVDFLRAIAGLRPPFSGSISVEDRTAPKPIRDLAEASATGIAYVSGDRAHDGIFPNLSIFENFALPFYRSIFGEFGWINPRPLGRAFAEQVRRLSIKVARASSGITSLSGGNQQKVLIARALASSPKIIVLDDPARGVDIGTKQELYAQLKDFAGRGGAVVYLSSEIEEFFDFADRVLVFRNSTLFTTLSSANFSEEALLAAMFGDLDPSNSIQENGRVFTNVKSDFHPRLERNQHLLTPILLIGFLLLAAVLRAPRLFTVDGIGGAIIVATPLILAALALTPIVLVGRGGVDLSVGPLLGFMNVSLVKWFVETGHASPILVLGYMFGAGVLYQALIAAIIVYVRISPIIVTLSGYLVLTGFNLVILDRPSGMAPEWMQSWGNGTSIFRRCSLFSLQW